MKICDFTENTASDYAYMATEAAAWENITKLLEISGDGSNTPALFTDLQTKIIQAAAADQTVKVSVLDLDL